MQLTVDEWRQLPERLLITLAPFDKPSGHAIGQQHEKRCSDMDEYPQATYAARETRTTSQTNLISILRNLAENEPKALVQYFEARSAEASHASQFEAILFLHQPFAGQQRDGKKAAANQNEGGRLRDGRRRIERDVVQQRSRRAGSVASKCQCSAGRRPYREVNGKHVQIARVLCCF